MVQVAVAGTLLAFGAVNALHPVGARNANVVGPLGVGAVGLDDAIPFRRGGSRLGSTGRVAATIVAIAVADSVSGCVVRSPNAVAAASFDQG